MTFQWSGRYALDEGAVGYWRIGSLRLWAWRRPSEWRLAYLHGDDPLEGGLDIEVPCGTTFSPPPDATLERYATRPDAGGLELGARLADRPMVARPEVPFHVLAGDTVSVFLSTPTWITVCPADGRTMLEVPTYRPSDTWFGPNTRIGELCYAARTSARLTLEQVVRRPGRAITELRLVNHGDDVLDIERLKVPVPHLGLYRSEDGLFWTERVDVVREHNDDQATITIAPGPPELAGATTPMAEARETGSPSMLVRALGALLT